MNIYQAMSRDYIHGERAELEKHMEGYKNSARSRCKNVQLVFSEGNAGEEIVKHIIPAVEPIY